jgi:hypothetical protein
LNGANIDIFFLVRERDSAGCESDNAKDDEKYSNNSGCLHGVMPFRAVNRRNLRSDAGVDTPDVSAAAFPAALAPKLAPE